MENTRYKTDKSLIVALGDVHGDWSAIRDFCYNYNDALIIQLGDFGIGFKHPIKEAHLLKKLNKVLHQANNELIVFRGNHDNPAKFTGKWVEEEICLAQDYTVIESKEGKTIQIIGGGISIDRVDRVPGKTWWEREEVSFQSERVEKVDVLLTHVAPSRFPLEKAQTNHMVVHFHGIESMQGGDLFGELESEKRTVQKISDLSECGSHYFGHYHVPHFSVDPETNRSYRCLAINEFRQIF